MDCSNETRQPTTVMIAVAVRLYRDGLVTILQPHSHLRVQGTAGTFLEARDAVSRLRPDVVIIDVALDDALSLIRSLRSDSVNSRILAFAVREDISTILEYAEAGADGFVTAASSMADLVEAIERIAAGELLCSPRIAAQLLRRAAQQKSDTAYGAGSGLTNRERQVFSLLKQGRSNKEIGSTLHIAEATVKNHVHRVLEKLHVTSRAQAATTGVAPLKAMLPPPVSGRQAS